MVHGVSPCAVQFRNVLGESAVVAGLGLFVIRAAGAEAPFVWGAGMGLLAGAAFISRYQVGFALFGFGLWLLVFARRWRLLAGLALGGAAMLGVGVLVDYWLYGTWTCSPVNYLRENILNSHIDKFGIKPWYFYLSDTVSKGFVVYGLAILAATCWFFVRNPKHVITWTMVPFLLAHQLVGHKELRFLFPVLPFIPFFAVLLARDLPQRVAAKPDRPVSRRARRRSELRADRL